MSVKELIRNGFVVAAAASLLALAFSLVGCAPAEQTASSSSSSSASASASISVSDKAQASASASANTSASPSATASASSSAASSSSAPSIATKPEASGENSADEQTDQANQEEQSGAPTATSADDYVNWLVWQNGLGDLISYSQTLDANGNWVLEVVTRGADGGEYYSTIGSDGSVLENGYLQAHPEHAAQEPYTDTEAAQDTFYNGLGEYISSNTVVGADGKVYHEITSRGADGNIYFSYLDDQGNVLDISESTLTDL